MTGKPLEQRISQSLMSDIMQKHNDGWSYDRINEWLAKDYDIHYTYETLTQKIRNIKTLVKRTSLDSIKYAAGQNAIDYISIMNKNIKQLDEISDKLLMVNCDAAEYLPNLAAAKQLKETVLRYIDRQLTITGAAGKAATVEDNEAVLDEILDKLNNNDK